jgi:hypothetical protein
VAVPDVVRPPLDDLESSGLQKMLSTVRPVAKLDQEGQIGMTKIGKLPDIGALLAAGTLVERSQEIA